MVLTTPKWDKMVDELWKLAQLKDPCNKNMCKDKWNGLNSNYIKVSNYHVRINHQIAF
jgi:hypothetical protein